MMEENKVDLVSQLYPQIEQSTEQPEEVEQDSAESLEVPIEQPKDYKQSWKELRDKADLADKYQRERDEYYRVLKQLEEQAYLQQQQSLHPSGTQEDADDSFDLNNIPDDDFLSGKDLKKVIAKQQRYQQKQYEEMMRQQKASHEKMIENDFKAKYNDFYDVVNTDNIAKLRELRPGLARSLHLNPDLKEKAEETYLAIKDLGIYRNNDFTKQKEVAQKNFSKPRSVNSVGPQSGDSPLNQANAFANGLTKELKKSLYQEMLDKAGQY